LEEILEKLSEQTSIPAHEMLDYLEGRIDWDTFLAGRLPNPYSGVTHSIEPIVTLERVVAWIETLSLNEVRPILDAALERAASLVDSSRPPANTPPFSLQNRFPTSLKTSPEAVANELLATEEPGTPPMRLARLVVALGEMFGEETALAQRMGIEKDALRRLKAAESATLSDRHLQGLLNLLSVTAEELEAYIAGKLSLGQLVRKVSGETSSEVAFEQVVERLPHLKFADLVRLWEALNQRIARAFQPFRKPFERKRTGREIEGSGQSVPAIALQDLVIEEMRHRGLLLAESGWEILASESTLDAQRLRELASGAQPNYLDIVAIEVLLESTRQPDGAPWSQSDLEVLVERDFGGLANWERVDDAHADSHSNNGDPLNSNA
jgi:hypothetical protein